MGTGGQEKTKSSQRLVHNQRCIGGRVYPGRDLSLTSANRCDEWLLREVPTVYRKESSPVGEADRAMRGNHLGSLSYELGVAVVDLA